MNKTTKLYFGMLLILFMLNGCATMVDTPVREVIIDTPPGVKAEAQISISDFTHDTGLPVVLEVDRSVNNKINVLVETPCGKPVSQTIPRESTPFIYGNGVNVLGYLIDISTGASRRYQPYNLVQVPEPQYCEEWTAAKMGQYTSMMAADENRPSNGEGWKFTGGVIMGLGFTVFMFDLVFDMADDLVTLSGDEEESKLDTDPILAGLLLGGAIYTYGNYQSQEYQRWKQRRYSDVQRIGVLINSESGVRLQYETEF